MTKNVKRAISLLLCLCLLLPLAVSGAVAAESNSVTTVSSVEAAMDIVAQGDDCLTECNGNCGHSPVIIVPGIMQSQVYVQDENGNDLLTVDGFPIIESMDFQFMFDTEKLKQEATGLIFPLLLSLLLRNDKFFLDKLIDLVDENAAAHYFNPDGTSRNKLAVDEYWYSLEEAKNHPDKSYNYAKGYSKDDDGNALPTVKYPTEFDFIYKQVNISAYCNRVGYDHAYFYAYSSFGDTLQIAERLNDYIQMVKQQTGHSKVNLVFISLGGTIGNAYLSEYCNPDDIDRVVFAAAAADGSYLLSDLMAGNFSIDNTELLYSEIVPSILTSFVDENMGWAGNLANLILRFIPQKFFTGFLNNALTRLTQEVLNNILTNCPSMWALVPSAAYPTLSAKYIGDSSHAALRAKTDKYYNIQKNAASTLQRLTAEGMEIFVVCGYDLDLPSVFDSYGLSSDNIIQATSASFGAGFAADGSVDASTAALPEKTWFIKGQSHLRLQSSINDTIEMCVQICDNKEIKDALINNGGYPQFNEYRDLREIESMLREYNALTTERIDAASPSDAQRAELHAAAQSATDMMKKRTWSAAEALATEKRLYTIMYDLALFNKMSSKKSPVETYELPAVGTKVTKTASDLLMLIFGGNDFWL